MDGSFVKPHVLLVHEVSKHILVCFVHLFTICLFVVNLTTLSVAQRISVSGTMKNE
jgi:hypothetical protein